MEDKDNIECRFCGEEIKFTAKKCKHCGEFLEKSINNGQPIINIVNQQNMNNDLSGLIVQKNWLIALLLSIFFGWFGFDRFYLGHGGSGIIKLFTMGGFGIWWIIDIFLILTKSIPGIKWK
ncbi:MAG: TM2 domain-containing protein [Candidatus Gracilibacteria bacterium]|nr:TM2 domain-containing protein [Candidatus Gracilibacteria bacterium]